jgi:hypothetical protein
MAASTPCWRHSHAVSSQLTVISSRHDVNGAARSPQADLARRATRRLHLRQKRFTKVKTSGGRPRISDRKPISDRLGASATQGSEPGHRKAITTVYLVRALTPKRLKKKRANSKSGLSRSDLTRKTTTDRRSPRHWRAVVGGRTLRGSTNFFSGQYWAQASRPPLREIRSERESS